ncbi:hypothetical protein ACNKHP_20860 [Shigella boydii]
MRAGDGAGGVLGRATASLSTACAAFADCQAAGLLFRVKCSVLEPGLNGYRPGSQLSHLPPLPWIAPKFLAAIVGNSDLITPSKPARQRMKEEIELFLSDEGDDVVIEVADQGLRRSRVSTDKIFEQGVSTRADEPGETGIGLT